MLLQPATIAICLAQFTQACRRDTDDPSQVGPLLDQIPQDIDQVTADGAYDGEPTYETVAARNSEIAVVIPPRATSVESGELGANATRREVHVHTVAALGKRGWQEVTGYGQRALVETAMGRYKSIVGSRLRARNDAGQLTEASIGVAVINRMLAAGRPNSVRNLSPAS